MSLEMREHLSNSNFETSFLDHMKEKGYWLSKAGIVGGAIGAIEDIISGGVISLRELKRYFCKSIFSELNIINFTAAVVASICQTANALGYKLRIMTEVQAAGVALGLSQSTIWRIDSFIKDKGWL